MSDLDPHLPHPLARIDLAVLADGLEGPGLASARLELRALAALREAGVPLAPAVVVPPAVEERFYRLNNLAERLQDLFVGVDAGDPDEDDLEERAPEARATLRTAYLLDEFVDAFYASLDALPAALEVRRPGAGGERVRRGRPALLALKRLWEADWTFEALLARTARGGGLVPTARPVLVHGRTHDLRDAEPAGRDPVPGDTSGRDDDAELQASARRALAAYGLGALRIGAAEGGVARLDVRELAADE